MTTRTKKSGDKAPAGSAGRDQKRPDVVYRSAGIQIPSEASLRAKSIDEEGRSVEAVIATEQPVEMWDWDRWEPISEILRADGMEVPKNGQVPMLDAHSRWSAASVLGSVREFTERKAENIARLHFSATAEDEWTKVREGHLDSVSVGYQVLKRVHVGVGKTKKVGGREYAGPVNVVTKWRLFEVSLVPIGADSDAKLRGYPVADDPKSPLSDPARKPDPLERTLDMDPKLRELLVKRGMPAELDDAAAQQWMIDNAERALPPAPKADDNPPAPARGQDVDLDAKIAKAIEDGIAKVESGRAEKRAAFRAEVDQLCELADMPAEFSRELYEKANLAEVRKAIVDEKAKRATDVAPALRISFGASQREKHLGCLSAALAVRAASDIGLNREQTEKFAPEKERAQGWEQFRYASGLDLAKECLAIDGVDIRGMSREDIATVALGFGHQIRDLSGGAYNVTASFPKLTQDAMNKSMRAGYEEFPSTWRGPFKQGPSVPDFKTIHRMQLGAVPNLPVWNDNAKPNSASMKDEDETYAVECYSLGLDFSYKLLVNDDMSVITSSPFKLGDAAARTVNAVAWGQITSNPTLQDGVALFAAATGNRKRTNLTTGAGAPAVATLQTLTNLMRQMRGTNTPEEAESDDVLNLRPYYIVGPGALDTTIMQLVNSIADPAASQAGVYNTARYLQPIIEPLLDAASTTAWYLITSPTRVDTVEVTFLQGQEAPRTREVLDQHKLTRTYYVLQTFAAKALDHRGMQKHAGA